MEVSEERISSEFALSSPRTPCPRLPPLPLPKKRNMPATLPTLRLWSISALLPPLVTMHPRKPPLVYLCATASLGHDAPTKAAFGLSLCLCLPWSRCTHESRLWSIFVPLPPLVTMHPRKPPLVYLCATASLGHDAPMKAAFGLSLCLCLPWLRCTHDRRLSWSITDLPLLLVTARASPPRPFAGL